MSDRVRRFLQEQGLANTYKPQGNDQFKRYNRMIWKTVKLGTTDKGVALETW